MRHSASLTNLLGSFPLFFKKDQYVKYCWGLEPGDTFRAYSHQEISFASRRIRKRSSPFTIKNSLLSCLSLPLVWTDLNKITEKNHGTSVYAKRLIRIRTKSNYLVRQELSYEA